MRRIARTTQFKRDVKRMKKRGKSLEKLRAIVEQLASGQTLSPQHRDHSLHGKYKNYRECHIEPDWLLIYRLTSEELLLVRTGSHADLFE